MTEKKRASPRPALFVGSSVEGLAVAYSIQEDLQHDADVTAWPHGVFDLSKSTLQSLVDQLKKSAFAIFVFTPDDRTRLRDKTSLTRQTIVYTRTG